MPMADESRWSLRQGKDRNYERDDGWLLFYNDRISTPHWAVSNAAGNPPPGQKGYNSFLGPEDVKEAQAWADGVIADEIERLEKERLQWPPPVI